MILFLHRESTPSSHLWSSWGLIKKSFWNSAAVDIENEKEMAINDL